LEWAAKWPDEFFPAKLLADLYRTDLALWVLLGRHLFVDLGFIDLGFVELDLGRFSLWGQSSCSELIFRMSCFFNPLR